MPTLESIQTEIENLKSRNARVESEKAWETSKTRIGGIIILTYIVATILMFSLHNDQPFFSALMPTLGFYLSTQSLPVLQRLWMRFSNK